MAQALTDELAKLMAASREFAQCAVALNDLPTSPVKASCEPPVPRSAAMLVYLAVR